LLTYVETMYDNKCTSVFLRVCVRWTFARVKRFQQQLWYTPF